jgi:hypothetical protein
MQEKIRDGLGWKAGAGGDECALLLPAWCHEPVTYVWDRNDKLRLSGIFLEFSAQAADVRIDCTSVRASIVTPNRLQEFASSN